MDTTRTFSVYGRLRNTAVTEYSYLVYIWTDKDEKGGQNGILCWLRWDEAQDVAVGVNPALYAFSREEEVPNWSKTSLADAEKIPQIAMKEGTNPFQMMDDHLRIFSEGMFNEGIHPIMFKDAEKYLPREEKPKVQKKNKSRADGGAYEKLKEWPWDSKWSSEFVLVYSYMYCMYKTSYLFIL